MTAKRPLPKLDNRAAKLWAHRRRRRIAIPTMSRLKLTSASERSMIMIVSVILVLYLSSLMSAIPSGALQQQQQQHAATTTTTRATANINSTLAPNTKHQSRRPYARQLFGAGGAGEPAAPLSLIGGMTRQSSHDASDLSSSRLVEDSAADPMEPCYLANNRASESLTISESTPVGTVVGEIMVNGDSSKDGNIELSIKMPTNGMQATSERRSANLQSPPPSHLQTTNSAGEQPKVSAGGGGGGGGGSHGKSARDLGALIDLMPPLSIEPGTKRVILAKKLDREDLDKYVRMSSSASSASSSSAYAPYASSGGNGFASSSLAYSSQSAPPSASSPASASSSQLAQTTSLTVHIKCTLKERPVGSLSKRPTPTPLDTLSLNESTTAAGHNERTPQQRPSTSKNSILIPVHLIVTDENDNWPQFIGAPYIIELNESAQVGSLLQDNEIVAFDNDQQGPLSTIEYSIVSGNYWSDSFAFLNPLDSRSLIVRDNRLLDFESHSKLALKVMARDQGEPSNWAIASLHINLLDADDSNPSFVDDKYYGYLRDNRPGEPVDVIPRPLLARDQDKSLNAQVIYSFHVKSNHSIHFDLDPETGKLSLKKSLPDATGGGGGGDGSNNNRQSFCLLVRATQADNPLRWSIAAINVRLSRPPSVSSQLEQLLSIGNEPPAAGPHLTDASAPAHDLMDAFKFSHTNYTIEVEESVPVGFSIFTARAGTPPAAGGVSPHATTTAYELIDNELGYFAINKHTGRLTINRSLDFELHSHLSVRILALHEIGPPDSGNAAAPERRPYPRTVCDVARLNVVVVDTNEFAPEFSHEQYNFQLPISDLIASFEPSRPLQDSAAADSTAAAAALVGHDSQSPNRRLRHKRSTGDLELVEQELDELMGSRVLQLGQVYCADRDSADKVSLQLAGSKANLFHLTQDGRLYLPLANVSARELGPSELSRRSRADQLTGIIRNQLVHNRFPSAAASPAGSSDYLNYLLGELSNLSRLRLKVIASDDGQPKRRQSDALIVLSIISIDNFILQRTYQTIGSPEQSGLGGGGGGQAERRPQLNETSAQPVEQTGNQSSQVSHSVMMIPAPSGRGFVQVNADIIGSFLVNTSATTQAIKSMEPQNESNANNLWPTNNRLSSEALDSAASSVVMSSLAQTAGEHTATHGTQVRKHQQLHHQHQQQGAPAPTSGDQPQQAAAATAAAAAVGRLQQSPSLLVVDEDGAKFLTMPAAIEVYNQQVQEAASLQQRQRATQLLFESGGGGVRRNAAPPDRKSLWSQWKSQLGLGNGPGDSQASSGPMFWVNLSTAVMLHFIALAIVVTLLVRVRSFVGSQSNCSGGGGGGGGNGNSNESNLTQSTCDSSSAGLNSLWPPAKWPAKLGSLLGAPMAIPRRPSTTIAINANLDDTYLPHSASSRCLSSPAAAAAAAMSPLSYPFAVPKPDAATVASNTATCGNGDQIASEPSDTADKQNVLGHLKLTLNKMLDICDTKQASSLRCKQQDLLGQITVRPLSSSASSMHSNNIDESTQTRTSSSAAHVAESQVQVPAAAAAAKSSTFVGTLASSVQKTGNIVSISVSAPKLEPSVDKSPKLLRPANSGLLLDKHRSTSSSAMSLVSMSSSSIASNKICTRLNGGASNESSAGDVSSLDSTTLFGAVAKHLQVSTCAADSDPTVGSGAAHAPTAAPAPPPPPPPPPPPLPPSIIQATGVAAAAAAASLYAVPPAPRLSPVSYVSPGNSAQKRAALLQAAASCKQQSAADRITSEPIGASGGLSARNSAQPQNPVHVKLRQQALSEQIVNDFRRQSSAKQRLESSGVLERVLPPTPSPAQVSVDGSGSGGNDGGHAVASDAAPASRQQSNNAPTTKAAAATGSPTTSVDRGYESLQSYTSSSQQQQQPPHLGGAKQQQQQQARNISTGQQQQHKFACGPSLHQSDLSQLMDKSLSPLEDGAKMSPDGFHSGVSASPPRLADAPRRAEGRQTVQRRPSQRRAVVDQPVAAATPATSNDYDIPNTSRVPSFKRGEAVARNENRSTGGAGLLAKRVQSRRSQATLSAVEEAIVDQPQAVGYETEDDDFYYCCDSSASHHLNVACVDPSAQSLAMSSSLIEYANHAYQVPAALDNNQTAPSGHTTKLSRHQQQSRPTPQHVAGRHQSFELAECDNASGGAPSHLSRHSSANHQLSQGAPVPGRAATRSAAPTRTLPPPPPPLHAFGPLEEGANAIILNDKSHQTPPSGRLLRQVAPTTTQLSTTTTTTTSHHATMRLQHKPSGRQLIGKQPVAHRQLDRSRSIKQLQSHSHSHSHSYTQHPHQQLDNSPRSHQKVYAGSGGGGNKKQLTWSDQVSMAS